MSSIITGPGDPSGTPRVTPHTSLPSQKSDIIKQTGVQDEVSKSSDRPAISQKPVDVSGKEEKQQTQEAIDVEELVESLNEHIKTTNRELKFSVNQGTGHTVITVVDSETKEVIRQIPPEDNLKLAELLHGSLSGLLDEML